MGLGGGAIADAAVGPFLVIVAAVIFGQDAGFGDAEHEFPVEALVAQAAVEAFDMTVLPRAARFYIESLDPAPGQPVAQDAGDKLAAVVTADVLGRAPFGHQSFHHFDQVVGRELAGHVQSETLPAVFVNEAKDTQSSAVVSAVGHEVPAPNVVEPLGPRRDRPRWTHLVAAVGAAIASLAGRTRAGDAGPASCPPSSLRPAAAA